MNHSFQTKQELHFLSIWKYNLTVRASWIYWVVWPAKQCFTVTLPSEHFMWINGELFQSPELVLCRAFLQHGNAEYPCWGLPNPALGFLGKTSLRHLQWAQQLMWIRENQCQYDLRSLAWSYGQQTKCKRIWTIWILCRLHCFVPLTTCVVVLGWHSFFIFFLPTAIWNKWTKYSGFGYHTLEEILEHFRPSNFSHVLNKMLSLSEIPTKWVSSNRSTWISKRPWQCSLRKRTDFHAIHLLL